MSDDDRPAAKGAPDWRHLQDHEKYEHFAREAPGGWWDPKGPVGGLHVLNRARIAYFQERLGGFSGRRVLDVGCGGGILSESLAQRGARVVGVDPSPASLREASDHARATGLEIDYRVGFAEEMEFREEFDMVFAVDVLEHVRSLEDSLSACAAALKPGGAFGFLTHNQTLEAFRYMIWEQEYQKRVMPKGAHDFHKFIAPEAMIAALRKAGLEVAEIRGLTRTGSGDSYMLSVSDDVSISYLGYAIKPLEAA